MVQAYLMFISVLLIEVYKKENRILKMILDKFVKQTNKTIFPTVFFFVFFFEFVKDFRITNEQ